MLSYEQTISSIADELFNAYMSGDSGFYTIYAKMQATATIFEKAVDVVELDARIAYENKKKAYYASSKILGMVQSVHQGT